MSFAKKKTRNIAFYRPSFNNLIFMLFCNCNGPNSTDKLAFCDKVWMRKIIFFKLQTLIFSNIKGVFGTADKSFILQKGK